MHKIIQLIKCLANVAALVRRLTVPPPAQAHSLMRLKSSRRFDEIVISLVPVSAVTENPILSFCMIHGVLTGANLRLNLLLKT